MKVWTGKTIDGSEESICCMTHHCAQSVLKCAEEIREEADCTVVDKHLEFAYLVELLHQKKEGVTVPYLKTVADDFGIKLTDISLHMYCQPLKAWFYRVIGESGYYFTRAFAENTLKNKNYIEEGCRTITVSVPAFVIECVTDGRIKEYYNTYVITDGSGYRYVSLAPNGVEEEAKWAVNTGGAALVEVMAATGLPIVMDDSGACRFVDSCTTLGPHDHIITMPRSSGAYLVEP